MMGFVYVKSDGQDSFFCSEKTGFNQEIGEIESYPVVNGGSDSSEQTWGTHVPNKYSQFNGEPRSCLEFPNHLKEW